MARYVLSERAADWLKGQMNAGYNGAAGPARLIGRDDSMPLPVPVHFELTRTVTSGVASWNVGAGAVQDGADTVWFAGGSVSPNATGETIVYAQLNETSKVVTVGVVASTSALATLQATSGVKVWPLYHMTDGAIDMDYRPIFSVGGGGGITFTGTSGTTSKANAFTIASESNSRVTVTCSGTTITVGVYYI